MREVTEVRQRPVEFNARTLRVVEEGGSGTRWSSPQCSDVVSLIDSEEPKPDSTTK